MTEAMTTTLGDAAAAGSTLRRRIAKAQRVDSGLRGCRGYRIKGGDLWRAGSGPGAADYTDRAPVRQSRCSSAPLLAHHEPCEGERLIRLPEPVAESLEHRHQKLAGKPGIGLEEVPEVVVGDRERL